MRGNLRLFGVREVSEALREDLDFEIGVMALVFEEELREAPRAFLVRSPAGIIKFMVWGSEER